MQSRDVPPLHRLSSSGRGRTGSWRRSTRWARVAHNSWAAAFVVWLLRDALRLALPSFSDGKGSAACTAQHLRRGMLSCLPQYRHSSPALPVLPNLTNLGSLPASFPCHLGVIACKPCLSTSCAFLLPGLSAEVTHACCRSYPAGSSPTPPQNLCSVSRSKAADIRQVSACCRSAPAGASATPPQLWSLSGQRGSGTSCWRRLAGWLLTLHR